MPVRRAEDRIEAVVREFALDLTRALRHAAIEAVREALAQRPQAAPARRAQPAKRAEPRAAAPSPTPPARKRRRSATRIVELKPAPPRRAQAAPPPAPVEPARPPRARKRARPGSAAQPSAPRAQSEAPAPTRPLTQVTELDFEEWTRSPAEPSPRADGGEVAAVVASVEIASEPSSVADATDEPTGS